jgi:amino acid adenylation domain-containing protein
MTDLLTRIENLSPARRKLLERMSAKKQQQIRTYPLSYAQRRMWFIDQLEPQSALYNMPYAIRFTGVLEVEIVRQAVQEIVRRHESLRTIFPQHNGVAVQEVLDEMRDLVQEISLMHLSEHQRENEMRRLVRLEAYRPFNLAQGPLFRVTLFQLSECEHVLMFNMHHIIGDGWSMGVLEQEFERLYESLVYSRSAAPPRLELQYGDFAVWQRGWLQSGAMQQQLEFWKEQLTDVAEVVLPTDYSRPPVLTHQGESIELPLPAELSAELREFCRREGVTLFMGLLAGLELAVSRYMGVRDFAIGTPIANRNRLETEKLIGCFINTLVLRTDLNDHLTFRELVARVRERTLCAYERQDMPFEKLVEELVPAHVLSRTPLFQVLFVLQNFPSTDCQLPGLTRSNVDTGFNMAKVEITITVLERDGVLCGNLQYESELFDRLRMQRLMEHFYVVLEAMVSDPEQNIWASSWLAQEEREQVLVEWNRTYSKYPQEKPVHVLIAEQAAGTPQAVAFVQEGQQLSYGELDSRANQLARYLAKQGVGVESAVGVCLERSAGMMVGLLGILKAGAAFVPLDPSYPAERLQWMAEDAGIKLLLVDERSMSIASHSATPVINLELDWHQIGQEEPEEIEQRCQPENLAYIIYTSGSTGKPKGVGITHRAACNQLCWAVQAFQITVGDRFLQKASISFDSSIEEIFVPLVAGARIVAARPRGEQDVEYLAELVAEQQVSCIDVPPSLLQAFVEYPNKAVWNSVRLVVSGGEELKPELVKAFAESFSGRLLNTYGPTETTVQCVWADGLDGEADSIPIGRPVANMQAYVLDEHGEAVPVGVAGELYVGGAGLGRGYIKRPELTAEKFVPNPFSSREGERLYRTGDMVRWCEDGNLDFIGRVDHQVKLRGFRIELGEIEKALESHEQVKQAVVTVGGDGGGDQQLVGYVVPSERALNFGQLREHLKARLPEYMIPAVWVEMKELPLNGNGKIDRKGLPEAERQWSGEEGIRPRNVTEEILAGIWEAVLKQEEVSVEASFFDLGGHSLLAMQVIARIRKAFSVEVPLRVLFEAPTVAGMAERLARQLQNGRSAEIPAMTPVRRTGPVPLSFAQQRLWFLDQLTPGSAAYNIPLRLRLQGELDHSALHGAWKEIVRRHEALRTCFPLENGEPVQKIGDAEAWQMEEISLGDLRYEGASEVEVKKWARAEAEKPFDLVGGPLLRVKLLQIAEQDHVLLVTMHHIVSDGWSVGIMLGEFSQLYAAYRAGEGSPLKELGLQYADYAAWQREWLQGEVLEEQLGYWRKQLAGIEPLELPTRGVRSEATGSAEASVGWALSEELSAELKVLSRKQGSTLFMTLLAAFEVLLSRYSGQNDVTVGTPIAGRRWEETHSLMGFFVNTLVLRREINANQSFAELLGKVRETTLEAYAHQDVPFEKLVEELQPERDLGRHPFFQTVFTYQNSEPEELHLPGLEISGLEDKENTGTAKFDLMLGAEESHGRIQGSFAYNRDLFDRAMMATMVRHWQQAVEQLVQDPSRPMMHVSLLTQQERDMLITEWKGRAIEGTASANFSGLISRHAQNQPQAPAVIANNVTLSYAGLNGQANQWAQYLKKQGVETGTRVGVCLKQASDCLAVSLGVVKAGGVLVGLEAAEPATRLKKMVESSGAAMVITTAELSAGLEPSGARLMCVEEQRVAVGAESDSELEVQVNAHSPALLLYRSYGAGGPVGVLLPQRVLCAVENEMDSSDRVAQACSFSGEASSIEMFRTLARGGCVVACKANLAPRRLAAFLRAQRVTVLWTTAAVLETVAREFPWALKQMRQIFCEDGRELVLQMREKLSGELLQRVYGVDAATEAGGCWRTYRLDETTAEQHLAAGTRMVLLESNRVEPAATGVLGEIYVAGEGMALGHDRQTDAFVADPFSAQAGTQMYRTGEFARLHPDGSLEHKGRRDGQMLCAGQRVYREEIEAVLRERKEVSEAGVVMHEQDSSLAALVVPAAGQVIAEEELRAYLLQRLPEAMVPRSIRAVEKISRNAEGKVRVEERVYVAPRTETEEQIAQIWQELLPLEQVSIHDDFFRLGGHSLLAVRLKTLLQDRLNWEMALADLFRAPTVAALAQLREQAQKQNESAVDQAWMNEPSIVVKIQAGSSMRTPLFFVHPVGGSVLCYGDLARELGSEQPFYGLQSPGGDKDLEQGDSLEQMASVYIRVMRQVQPTGPYLLGGWSFGGLLAWEMARQLGSEGERVGMLALIDSYPTTGAGWTEEEPDEGRMLDWFAEDIGRMVGEDVAGQKTAWQEMGKEERMTAIEELLRRNGLVSRNKAREQSLRLLEVFARNTQATERYTMQKREQQVMLFAAAQSAAGEHLVDEWTKWTAAGVDLQIIAGDHYSMMRRPNVTAIATTLNLMLNSHSQDYTSLMAVGETSASVLASAEQLLSY